MPECVLMSDSEEYWRNAAEAQRMADNSYSAAHKAAWMRIAEQWVRMLSSARSAEATQADKPSRTDPKASP